MCTARVLIQCITYVVQFVGLLSCSHEIILEWHFLSNNHAIINYPQAQIELLPLWEPQQNELSIKLMVADDTGIPPSCSVIEPVSCNVAADTTVVFTPSVFFVSRKLISLIFAVLQFCSGSSLKAICNASFCPITLFQGECLEFVEPVYSSHVGPVPDEQYFFPVSTLSPECIASPRLFLQSINTDLTSVQRDQLIDLLQRSRESFNFEQAHLGTHVDCRP